MFYKNLYVGKTVSFSGSLYTVGSLRTYSGLLKGCLSYTFYPENKSLFRIKAFQWSDGRIERFKFIR